MARPQLTAVEVERFRDSVAEAAFEMVAEEGVSSLTLRRLAARLGCSYAKPYSYYRDKEQLVDAVRGRAFDRLAEYVTEAAASGALTAEMIGSSDEWVILAGLIGAGAGVLVARNSQTGDCAYSDGAGGYYTAACP